jgi:uncharacterized protein YkwD
METQTPSAPGILERAKQSFQNRIEQTRESLTIANIMKGVRSKVDSVLSGKDEKPGMVGTAYRWIKKTFFTPKEEEKKKPTPTSEAEQKKQLAEETDKNKEDLENDSISPEQKAFEEKLKEHNERDAKKFVDQLNQARKSIGKKPLKLSSSLSEFAQTKATKDARAIHCAHDATFENNEGVATFTGENLGLATSVNKLLKGLNASKKGHPRWIYSDTFKEIGFGRNVGADGKNYFALHFTGGNPISEGQSIQLPTIADDPEEYPEINNIADCERDPLMKDSMDLFRSWLSQTSPEIQMETSDRFTKTLKPEVRKEGAICVTFKGKQDVGDEKEKQVSAIMWSRPPHFTLMDGTQVAFWDFLRKFPEFSRDPVTGNGTFASIDQSSTGSEKTQEKTEEKAEEKKPDDQAATEERKKEETESQSPEKNPTEEGKTPHVQARETGQVTAKKRARSNAGEAVKKATASTIDVVKASLESKKDKVDGEE